jgi:glycosyltransferase involved in cell wall biosynthesis
VPGDASLLVPPGDHVALADALASLLSGPVAAARRTELAAAALRHSRALPTWDDAARQFAEAILELAPSE